jgi:hypothetical protein
MFPSERAKHTPGDAECDKKMPASHIETKSFVISSQAPATNLTKPSLDIFHAEGAQCK